MLPITLLLAVVACWSRVAAHLVLSYPGWRGDNLHSNGTNPDGSIPTGSLGMEWDNETQSYNFPWGMQWIYPCGGMATTTNRTLWPIGGGAVAFQPGWFAGHQYAFIYINLGIGTEPLNYSHPMTSVFQIVGPTNYMYPGTFCLPQISLPANISFNIGDNATIQIVETAVHGAALYSCVDITFADPADVPQVNSSNCFNSTGGSEGGPMGFNYVYTATGQLSGAVNVYVSKITLFSLAAIVALALSL